MVRKGTAVKEESLRQELLDDPEVNPPEVEAGRLDWRRDRAHCRQSSLRVLVPTAARYRKHHRTYALYARQQAGDTQIVRSGHVLNAVLWLLLHVDSKRNKANAACWGAGIGLKDRHSPLLVLCWRSSNAKCSPLGCRCYQLYQGTAVLLLYRTRRCHWLQGIMHEEEQTLPLL